MTDLTATIREKASRLNKHVLLPEGNDERMIRAAARLVSEKICRVTLFDESGNLRVKAGEMDVSLDGVDILRPESVENLHRYADVYYELRKHKGITRDQALKIAADPLYLAALMVKEDDADASLAGAVNSTGNVLRAAIQCIGLAEHMKIVSSCFLMIVPEWKEVLTFGDCAVVPDPDPGQLASIAIASAKTHRNLTGAEPVVAMLSFSTKGSADHEMVEKVREATRLVKEKAPDLRVDGELQLDAAIVPSIGQRKAPDSPVAGKAKVLIFPDLNAGNIGYKLVQRLAGAEAVGPVVQGLAKPANDLSRGCSVEDIVNTAAICCLLAG